MYTFVVCERVIEKKEKEIGDGATQINLSHKRVMGIVKNGSVKLLLIMFFFNNFLHYLIKPCVNSRDLNTNIGLEMDKSDINYIKVTNKM